MSPKSLTPGNCMPLVTGLLVFTFGAHFATAADSPASLAAGNALNPAGIDLTERVDPLGMSEQKEHAKTPTGLLYPPPRLQGSGRDTGNGWLFRGSVEAGYLGQDDAENAAEFHDYRDVDDGFLVNYLGVSWFNPGSNTRINLVGGGLGRDDQYLRFNAVQPGRFGISGFLSELPHEYSRNATTLFQGAGTTRLTLPATLQPGNNTLDDIRAALANGGNPALSIRRQQSGMALEYVLGTSLTSHAGYRHQQRQGARPFGGTLFPPFYTLNSAGGMIETIEPVDSSTNEFNAGFTFASTRLNGNLDYKNSFYRNHAGTLTYDVPFANVPGTDFLVEQGRYDLYPDNDYHELSGDLVMRLARNAQVFGTASWSTMRQDDALLAPTVNSGLTFAGIDLDQWNSTSALSVTNANARIDTLLLQAGLRLQPLNRLNINGTVRRREQDNDAQYQAFNPLTGEYGFITADGAAGDTVFAPGRSQEPFQYRSIPYAEDVTNWELEANYQLQRRTSLSVGATREERRPAWRERRRVNENALKTSLTSRALAWSTWRLSYEWSDRNGDTWDSTPHGAFYSSALPGFVPVLPEGSQPRALEELRMYDLGDFRKDKWSLKGTFLLGEAMTLMLMADYRDTDYAARFGLQDEKKASYSLEWNYQPNATFNAYAFFTRQDFSSAMATVNDGGFSTDASAGGDTFPLEAAWQQQTDGSNHFAGMGLRLSLGKVEVDSSYSYNHSRDGTVLLAASDIALASPFSGPLDSTLPALAFARHSLETSVRWLANDRLAWRLYHRYESSSTEDWHYAGLQPLVDRSLFLNARPQDYKAHLIGLFVQYRLQ